MLISEDQAKIAHIPPIGIEDSDSFNSSQVTQIHIVIEDFKRFWQMQKTQETIIKDKRISFELSHFEITDINAIWEGIGLYLLECTRSVEIFELNFSKKEGGFVGKLKFDPLQRIKLSKTQTILK